jgi:hypothetical protein
VGSTPAGRKIQENHAATIENDRTEETQTGSAQRGSEKETPASRPAFAAPRANALMIG